jgi:putative CocE/NonD family hydrolase
MPHRTAALLALLLLPCLAAAQAAPPTPAAAATAANAAYLREHYTKYEHRIPMRDGVKLFTAVYAPKDDSKPHPILLSRTPYSCRPYGVDQFPAPDQGPMRWYAKEGFTFVFQDVRGRYASEGKFEHVRPINPHKSPTDVDESTDAWDTIEWLVKHVPDNNGKVGMSGISYPGFYTAEGMIDSHPALKCASPQAPVTDWFAGDDFHHNGAFYLPHAFGWLSMFGQRLDEPTREAPKKFDYKTRDGYAFYLNLGPLSNADKVYFKDKIDFWPDLMRHGTYDEFWQARNLRPHLKNVKAAVMTVGGWFDAEDLFGALAVFRSVDKLNADANNILVMGPWPHGGWSSSDGERLGNVSFDAKTSEFYRAQIELPFFKHYLDGDAKDKLGLPKAYVFETGTNQWRRYAAWPPANTRERTLYFQPAGKLAFDAPKATDNAGDFDEYVSDPAKPVPYIPNVAIGMSRQHMVDDQRFASSRPDVLVYQTDPLSDDVTFAGPIRASLNVATTGTDSDFVVKLIDVYTGDHPNPDPNPAGVEMAGYQQLVRGECMRGKFRNGLDKPEPFKPGEVTKVEWTLPDVNHTFRRGHRIMIHVQSSWFPLVDRNPQTFCDIYHAKPEDFRRATQRIYRSPNATSSLTVQVLTPPEAGIQFRLPDRLPLP